VGSSVQGRTVQFRLDLKLSLSNVEEGFDNQGVLQEFRETER
jgi:hypothetical protein